ncbi:hypothetical protein BJG93_36460 (plasmid) [Paraburkholderia sprentiae WSM5005]|uniref:Uncharacterized protein n=1 Tax=Paraburkholderia sprentiae WSM5005 TaxID=754502 RepID=A0A8F4QIT5_9BURK|nr:hypothetical protein [Paraburkholderia sprentiae]QXE07354.1 hypothetical protein BJG93_36460 [Paraburkholderia sprentiae WSM5005]
MRTGIAGVGANLFSISERKDFSAFSIGHPFEFVPVDAAAACCNRHYTACTA